MNSKHPLYSRWADMKTRCACETHAWFHRYGGRGIKVCSEWYKFDPFKQWAETNGFSSELVLDRADNDGDYTPENCRWATKSESMYNREFDSDTPGVYSHPSGWVAKAGHKHVGYFDTKEEAVEARAKYLETGKLVRRHIRRKRTDNKSGHPGVYQRSTGKWMAKFKSKYLGQFDTFEEAVVARKRAETQ